MTYITRPPDGRLSLMRSPQELGSSLLIGAISLAGLWIGRDWEVGTLASVQAGFFPRLVCVLLLLLGLANLLKALAGGIAAAPRWSWRPTAAITVAVISFATVLDYAGLVLAILALIGIGGFAGQPLRLRALISLWVSMAASCIVIFSWGLGLPLPIWP